MPHMSGVKTARACFCGGSLGPGVHPLYGSCTGCGSQVQRIRPSPEELAAFYGLDAYWREHVVKVLGFPSIEERARSDMVERVAYWVSLLAALGRPPKSLLEIGCAHGGFLALARERGVPLVVGVEVDEGTCRFARETFLLDHVCAGLFPDVALPLASFEAVCGFDVIEHFSDPVGCLAHVRSILEPGGYFLFQTPCYRGQPADWLHFQPNEHLFLYTEEGLHRLFALAGLRLDFIAPGYFPHDVFAVGGAGEPRESGGAALVRADSIGDAILFSSALEPLGHHFGDTPLTLVCQEHLTGLFDHCPHVSDVVGYNRHYLKHFQAYQVYLASALRRRGFNLAINTAYSRDDVADMLAINTGAAERVALAGDMANTTPHQREAANARYTRLIESPGAWKPEIARTADLLAGLGVTPTAALQPKIWIGAADREFADRFFSDNGLGEDVLALYCGAQYAVRLYAHYGAALAGLMREMGLSVIALGSDNDLAVAERNLADLPGRVFDLFGKTTLGQAAALMSKCRLAAGAETGLAHMACAVGVPNAVLLGGGHFGRFMPWSPLTAVACLPLDCYACDWHCRCEQVYCVRSLAPMVFEAACRAALAGPADPAGRPRIFMQSRGSWPAGPDLPAWSEEAAARLLDDVELIEVAVPPGRDPLAAELAARAGELAAAGRTDAALVFYRKALLHAPDDHEILYLAADSLIALNRPAEALGHLSRSFERYPHDARTVAALAGVLRAGGRDALAREIEAVFLELHPEYRGA